MLSFGKKRKARAGIRAALLAGATVAAIGLGSAGSASAALNCTGNNIFGQGASLQKVAQQNVWGPGFASTACPGGPTITYNSTGSGGGLQEWNHNGLLGHINTAIDWVSTDDAPTAAQIANITSVAGGAKLLTIPVTQTALAVIADPPEGCEVDEITNKDLENVFNGAILKWSQLSTVLAEPSPACNWPIKRVVRKDGSGTTYQWKNYLYKINTLGLPCTVGNAANGGATWKELEPITNGDGTPNTTWPEDEGCAVTRSPLLKPAANGNGEVVKKVYETVPHHEGLIAYTALPDAEAGLVKCTEESNCHNTRILKLQNNGKKKLSEASFSDPALGEEANCETALYPVPALARRATTATHPYNVDWSQVFGAKIDTTATGGGYPACTITFALAFNHYGLIPESGFTEAKEITVNDYLHEYMVQTGPGSGQAAIASKYYAPLPTAATTTYNVLDAAQFAASKIGF